MNLLTDPLDSLARAAEPDSPPNPLVAELYRPALEREAFEDQQIRQWRADSLASIEQKALDFDSFEPSQPAEVRQRALVSAFLETQHDLTAKDTASFDLLRDRKALELFGESATGSDQAFVGALKKLAQEKADEKDLTAQLATLATAAEVRIATGGTPHTGPGPHPDSVDAALGTLETHPAYKTAHAFRYREEWTRTREMLAESSAPFREELRNVIAAFEAGDTGSIAAKNAYFTIPEDQHREFLAHLSLYAKTLAPEKRAEFWQNLRKQTGRDTASWFSSIAEGTMQLTDNLAVGFAPSGPGGDPTGVAVQSKIDRDARNFRDDVELIATEDFDPIAWLTTEGSWGRSLEAGAYGAPGAVSTTLTAMIPGVGTAAVLAGMTDQAYTDQRRSLIAEFKRQGLNDATADSRASEVAATLAPVIAAPQAAIEKLQALIPLGKAPGLRRLGDAMNNGVARFASRWIGSSLAETATELTQDAVPLAIRNIAAAIDDEIPGSSVSEHFKDYGKTALQTFVAVAPLGILAGATGISRDAKARAFADAPDLHRQAVGMSPEDSARLAAAAQQGPASLLETFESIPLAPGSESARAARQQISEAETRRALAEETLRETGALPAVRVTTSPDGSTAFEVRDLATGHTFGTVSTPQEVAGLIDTHLREQDRLQGDRLDYLLTTLQAAEASTRAGTDAANVTTTDVRLDETRTVAQEIAEDPEAEARVLAQIRAREAVSDPAAASPLADIVLGRSSTEFRQRVRHTVNRIHQGASILTVFHEEAHGRWREALATGRLTRQDALDFFQAVDARLAEKDRFLPADPAQITDEALDEAIAELMEVETLRTRRNGVRTNLPRGIVSRNLRSLAKLAGARRFADFVRFFKTYFERALSRTVQLRQRLAKGDLDAASYDTFLNKLLGLEEQAYYDQLASEAETALLDGAELAPVGEGDPFSLGPVRLPSLTQISPEVSPGADGKADSVLSFVSIRDPEGVTGPEADSATSESPVLFQSAPGRPGDSPRGDGGMDTSFSIGRARENFENARAAIIPIREAIAEAENALRINGGTSPLGARWRSALITKRRAEIAAAYTPPAPGSAVIYNGRPATISDDGERVIYGTGRFDSAPVSWLAPRQITEDLLVELREQLADAEATLYLAEEEFDPETDARQAAAEAIQRRELDARAAAFAAMLDARDEDARNASKSFVARVWNAYAQHDELFQFGRTNSRRAADIAAAVSMPGRQVTASESGDSVRFMGKEGFLDIANADTQRPYIRASSAGSQGKKSGGGSQLYAAALDWIHNNGKRIKDDPAGITGINGIRRTSNFLASAIRHGTTRHLKPHASQAVGKWTKNDVLNFALLANKEAENAFKAIPQARDWTFDFTAATFLDPDGKPLTETELDAAVTAANPAQSGIGLSTLQRAIITRSAVEAFQRGEVAGFVESAESGLPDSLTGVSYSLGPAGVADALRGDALKRIRDPQRRAEVMQRIARQLEELRNTAEELELAAGSKRLAKSLRREAAVRQAIRQEELENAAYARHMGVLLAPEESAKLLAQPVHAHLVSETKDKNGRTFHRGRLLSKSAAAKRHPDLFATGSPAEYDGAGTANRILFGGTLAPDLAAQELFDAGLIPDPSPDAMWQALEAEAASVAAVKESLTAAKADLRAAPAQAARETREWLAGQTENQQANFSDKQQIVRALALLDGILNALPPAIRGKIGGYTQLARIGSDETRLDFLRERLARADRELERFLREQFGREFIELLDRARPQRDEAGKRAVGKLGADVHDLFAMVREIMGITHGQAEARLRTMLTDMEAEWERANPTAPADAAQPGEEIEDTIQRLGRRGVLTPAEEAHALQLAVLTPLVADWTRADAARREAAVTEGLRIYQEGYLKFSAETARKREERNTRRAALEKQAGPNAGREARIQRARQTANKRGRVYEAAWNLLSFEQVVDLAFGEDSADGQRLVEWEARAAAAKHAATQRHLDALDETLAALAAGKFQAEQLRHKLAENTFTITDWRGQPATFSQLQAIQFTLMWRQEDGRRHMEGHLDEGGNPVGEWHWRQEDADAIEDSLTPEAKALRLHLTRTYAAEYERLNPVFRQLYGVSLPRHKFYSPLTVKPTAVSAGQLVDPLTGSAVSGTTLTPGALKKRIDSGVAEPDFRDALEVFLAHVRQMEHWMAYAPFATEANALLNTRQVGNAIEANAGREALQTLREWLDLFAMGGVRTAGAGSALSRGFARFMSRFASMALVGRVSVLAIQSTQLAAAAAEMPAGAYLQRLGRLFAGRLDWSAAMKSEFIRQRLDAMPPAVRQAMEGLGHGSPSRLTYLVQRLGRSIAGADALFTAGTYAITYDYQLAQAARNGLTGPEAEAYARQAAERSVERVAQPTRAATRSLYENQQTGPTARMVWNFASEPRQKLFLLVFRAMKAHKKGGWKAVAKDPAFARAFFVTWVAGGAVATLIRAAMRDIRDDRDEEIFDERNWDPLRLALSSLTGPLQGVPVMGEALHKAIFAIGDEFAFDSSAIDLARPATAARDLFTGESFEDGFSDTLRDLESTMQGIGYFSDQAAAATSIMHMVRDLEGVASNLAGND